MRPIQIQGIKYDYQTGIAEFSIEDSIPSSSADQFGLSIKIPTLITTNKTNAVTIRARNCNVFLRQGDKPIRVGQCEMEFASGHRREVSLSSPHNATTLYLNIFFQQHELRLAERFRLHGDLRLNLELEFIFVEDTSEYREKTGFAFVDDYKIAKSNWENILKQTNYLMSESVPISELISTDPSWSKALNTLQKARNRLNSGDGVAALDEVDQVLKRFVRFPYNGMRVREGSNQDSWLTYIQENFPHIEKPKQEAIAQLMGGLGGYLNKTSHHKEDINTPTSHYEHELIVTTVQLLLTYLYRIDITERPPSS